MIKVTLDTHHSIDTILAHKTGEVLGVEDERGSICTIVSVCVNLTAYLQQPIYGSRYAGGHSPSVSEIVERQGLPHDLGALLPCHNTSLFDNLARNDAQALLDGVGRLVLDAMIKEFSLALHVLPEAVEPQPLVDGRLCAKGPAKPEQMLGHVAALRMPHMRSQPEEKPDLAKVLAAFDDLGYDTIGDRPKSPFGCGTDHPEIDFDGRGAFTEDGELEMRGARHVC